MGIELVFIGSQVSHAADLKNPANCIAEARKTKTLGGGCVSLEALLPESVISLPTDHLGWGFRSTTTLVIESVVYKVLLKSRLQASGPFRKWVTEEVLPTIRKIGKYNAEESDVPALDRVPT